MALTPETKQRMRAAILEHRDALLNGTIVMAAVAERHGLTPHLASMYGVAVGLGIDLRAGGRTRLDHGLIITLYEQGLRVADIQRQIGHPNRQAIDKIIKRYLDENPKK